MYLSSSSGPTGRRFSAYPKRCVGAITTTPLSLYLLITDSSNGPCVLQSPHQCAHRNSTTGLPFSAENEGGFGPGSHSFADATGIAGCPARLIIFRFLFRRMMIEL